MITKKNIFRKIGLFPKIIKSGGDFNWTFKAYKNGYRLYYKDTSIIKHPARSYKELTRKIYRLGTGIQEYYKRNDMSLLIKILKGIRLLLPPNYFIFRNKLKNNEKVENNELIFIKVWLIGYWFNLIRFISIGEYFIKKLSI